MFDGKVFRSVLKRSDVEIKVLPYYFDKILKECHNKKDFCKHCVYQNNSNHLDDFISRCHFCLDLEHMQFEPVSYELYDLMCDLGKIMYTIN